MASDCDAADVEEDGDVDFAPTSDPAREELPRDVQHQLSEETGDPDEESLKESEPQAPLPDAGDSEPVFPSEAARRWAKLRTNFRLAALRSIAQDKREALKKLQEVRKKADKAQEAQSDSRTCKICWDRATDTVCLDCGHQCMCTRCGSCMTFCPICMQDISELVELQ